MIKIKNIKIKGIEITDSSDIQNLKEIAEARSIGVFAKLISDVMRYYEKEPEPQPKEEKPEVAEVRPEVEPGTITP